MKEQIRKLLKIYPNCILLIMVFLIVLTFTITINQTKTKDYQSYIGYVEANNNLTKEQKAIREVADAYYQKEGKAQYSSWRLARFYSPEEATSQRIIYSVCSNFTYSVYYQAFGIYIHGGYASTGRIISYGREYYDVNNIETNDVVEYWQKTTNENNNPTYLDNKGNVKNIDLSTTDGINAYVNRLLKEYKLQVGDVICYHPGGNTSGHALIVYDIIYNKEGEPIDAVLRESTSSGHEQKTTKITKGLSFTNIFNENNNVHEGTFRELYLANKYIDSSTTTRSPMINTLKSMSYFTILRPLLKNKNGDYTGKYYYATFKSQSNNPADSVCTGRTLKDYKITESTLNRLTYSSINIEKTVNTFNNSIVNLGDTLEYTIKVKNNSKTPYNNLEIIENISDNVNILDNSNGNVESNKIKWKISTLSSGQSTEIKYKVTVKKDISLLGKNIISTGTVGGIPSSTIQNFISYTPSNNEKEIISNKTEKIIADRKAYGQELISKIYTESFGINLEINKLDITDLIKVRDGLAYYPANADRVPTIYLNKENSFSNMVLSNYYGGLYTTSDGIVYLKYWENVSYPKSRSERADTIYKENFQTGDVLVYKNIQNPEGKDVIYRKENGTYYLIYISENNKITIDGKDFSGFVGIDESGEVNKIADDYTSLQTLLGKDYYVIFRPSMKFNLEKMKLNISYSTVKKTNKDVTVTITSNKKMLGLSGWTLSSDSLKLTKVYNKNTSEIINIKDLSGNNTEVKILISNIQNENNLDDYLKNPPTGSLNVLITIGILVCVFFLIFLFGKKTLSNWNK